MLVRMWRNRNSPSIAGGMQNAIATLEGSLAISQKLNTLLPYDLSIALTDIYPNELKEFIYSSSRKIDK